VTARAERQGYQRLNEPGRTPVTFPAFAICFPARFLALPCAWEALGRRVAGKRGAGGATASDWALATLPDRQTHGVFRSRTTPRRDPKRKISSGAIPKEV